MWARTGTKPIHAVRWTLNGARIVKTKKRGNELMQVWKHWYTRKGWVVRGNGMNGYIASDPNSSTKHACVLYSYDPKDLSRV